MKRIFTLALFFVFFKCSYSQIDVGHTTFEDRTVNVYPYRVESSAYSTDNHYLQTRYNLDVPFCPLSLPDGEYVAYYPKQHHYDKNGNMYYAKGDTDDVAILFTIKDKKKEGKAQWFTQGISNKQIYLTGNYSNDLKEGAWSLSNKYQKTDFVYHESLLDGDVEITSKKGYYHKKYHLTNGILNGEYLLENLKQKDITKIQFVNGKASGAYYTLLHKSALKDINIIRSQGYQNTIYKTIEVKGQLFENLKYGTWEFKLDDTKIRLDIDTSNTFNFGSGYIGEVGYNIEEGKYKKLYDLFNAESLRAQIITNRNHEFVNPAYNNEYWHWDIATLLSFSYGKFTEFDKKGNIINTDSFYDQSLKAPFQLKNTAGKEIVRFEKSFTNDSVYQLQYLDPKKPLSLLFSKTDNYLTLLETKETTFTKYRVRIEYRRELDYFRAFPTNAKTLTMDSSLSIYNDKDTFIYIQLLHVPTGYKYSGYYRSKHNFSTYPTVIVDSSGDGLTVIESHIIGSLTLTDTSFIRLLNPMTLSTYSKYQNNDKNGLKYARKQFFDDSIHFGAFWNGKPLTGDLNISLNYNYKTPKAKEVEMKHGFVFADYKTIDAVLNDYYLDNIVSVRNSEKNVDWMNLSFENGQLKGTQELYCKLNQSSQKRVLLNRTQFANNLKNGYDQTYQHEFIYPARHFQFVYRFFKYFRFGSRHHRRPTRYKHKAIQSVTTDHQYLYYIDGKLHGQAIINNGNSSKNFIMQFESGLLNGEFIKLNSYEQPFIKCHFLNDTLHGYYEDFNGNNEVMNTVNFKHGYMDGFYHQYQYINPTVRSNEALAHRNISFCNSRKVNTIELEFKDGYLINTGKYYHCDGILKAEIKYDIQDSIRLFNFHYGNGSKYTLYQKPSFSKYVKRPYANSSFCYINGGENNAFDGKFNLDFYSYLPGYYKYFYKSGVQSQEGRVDRSGLKTGWWKFWNENGIMMKEILYEKGFIIDPIAGKDTIFYTGRIKGYYPNGKFMMEGLVLDESLKYECVQDEEIAYQHVFYTRFMDEKGNENFSNYSGLVRDYHINGNKRQEGMLLNAKKDGVWRTYESNGNLNSIGGYKNGLKEGLWLTGDLSGIGFVDNECFDGVIDVNKIKGNLSELKLEFEEAIYKNGEVLKITSHNVNLR